MIFVSITRLRVRSWRYLPAFTVQALRPAWQAKRARGNLSVSIMREGRNTFWTRTAWENEEAMRAFTISGTHRRTMPYLLEWCDEASIAHWLQDSSGLPSWEEAHRRMLHEGRRSKVNHPSASHRAYDIASLDMRATRELRLK
jgi:heme-degrading monooxygenase HmoA